MNAARISWSLPPGDLIDAKYAPSLWRTQKFTLKILLVAILGHLTLQALLKASKRFHRLLAETPRKRKLQMQYPVKKLS
jgi:hypothetical protein